MLKISSLVNAASLRKTLLMETKVVPFLCVKTIWQVQHVAYNLQYLSPAHAEREMDVDHSHAARATSYCDLEIEHVAAARVLVVSLF